MASEAEKYEVLERIGQGSFGVIRRVKRKADGLVLCRKEICYTKMSDKERHQLQAELNILRQLDHPNIVHYYEKEHHKESHDLHLYMEYCGNGDLGIMIKDLKARSQYADEELVWTIFAQLVSALYRCHYGEEPPSANTTAVGLAKNALPIKSKQACERMILHRDLKPENVFLGEGNAVKLGDFGLSKIISSHDFASTYVGTPFYMSPEICAAERYSLYSDIWSLGCVIYELCAREPPFNARTHLELIQKIKIGKVAPLPRNYSRELFDVITACLQVNPNSRPDTAALLNLPRVKLIRKSQQSALVLQQHMSARDQALDELRLARDLIAQLEAEKLSIYDETNKKLHLEWETRAHLEINRRVDLAEKRLGEMFEQKVEEEVIKRIASLPQYASSQATSNTSFTSSLSSTSQEPKPILARSSTPTALIPERSQRSSLPPLSESTLEDSTSPKHADLSTLSLEDSPLEKKAKPMKRSSRTPFTRARTIATSEEILPSPMDVQMVDPSPVRNLAGLSLSPRRTGTAAADTSVGLGSGLRQPAIRGNIFAANAKRSGLAAETLFADDDDFSEDDDGTFDNEQTESPTRAKAPISTGDPFKAPARPGLAPPLARPGMLRQKTTPAHLGGAHARMKSTPSASNVFALAAANTTQIPVSGVPRPASPRDTENIRPGSPNRTKLIGPKGMTGLAGSPIRKAPAAPAQMSPTALHARKNSADRDRASAATAEKRNSKGDGLEKQIARSKVQGRTLVELSRDEVVNAGAGSGRSTGGLSGAEVDKLGVGMRCLEPPIWDPERDEMPSPFLVRARRVVAGR